MLSLQDYFRKNKNLKDKNFIRLSEEQIKKIQSLVLQTLIDFDSFCKRNSLRYILAGGSALGAVRHKGFIPWDDDADLLMPRSDYNKLVELFETEMSDKYTIASPSKKHKHSDMSVRIIKKGTIKKGIFDRAKLIQEGIGIDISAIDSAPTNVLKYYFKGILSDTFLFLINSRLMFLCRSEMTDRFFSCSFISYLFYWTRICLGAMLFVPYNRLCYIFDRFIASSDEKTNQVCVPTGRNHYFKETYSRDVLFPFKDVDFEGHILKIANDPNAYLSQLYGSDYMSIPPYDKREPHACTYLKME